MAKPTIYTKDKNVRITFRCDEKLSDWVLEQSSILGLTPSAFCRQILFSQMSNQRRIESIMEKTIISTGKAMIEDEHNKSDQ